MSWKNRPILKTVAISRRNMNWGKRPILTAVAISRRNMDGENRPILTRVQWKKCAWEVQAKTNSSSNE
jgi:hypothetical protein